MSTTDSKPPSGSAGPTEKGWPRTPARVERLRPSERPSPPRSEPGWSGLSEVAAASSPDSVGIQDGVGTREIVVVMIAIAENVSRAVREAGQETVSQSVLPFPGRRVYRDRYVAELTALVTRWSTEGVFLVARH